MSSKQGTYINSAAKTAAAVTAGAVAYVTNTAGAIAGLSSIGDNNGFVTGAVNTAVMTAIGTGIGAAVDYLINKQRENTANKIDYRA